MLNETNFLSCYNANDEYDLRIKVAEKIEKIEMGCQTDELPADPALELNQSIELHNQDSA
jgi:hypothetical protein